MSQSLAKVLIHIIYSTKNRTPWLKDATIRAELYAYQATVLQCLECPAIVINGVENHVHILCLLSRKIALKDLIEQSKTSTSKWIKTKRPEYHDFHWQNGYGVFSVSQSHVEEVKLYIAGQAEHHKKMSFQDEFRAFCDRHEIAYDERYVWD
jgi:putative transposase